MFSLQNLQKKALLKIFNLNKELNQTENQENERWNEIWKILIYDKFTHKILSILFNIKDLKELGIILQLQINQPRESIPDSPAIYICKSSLKNIEIITKDISLGLYDQYYLNFIPYIPQKLLYHFAKGIYETNQSDKMNKIYEHYLKFISIEEKIFTLDIKNSYSKIYLNTSNTEKTKKTIDSIIDGLFSVVSLLNTTPVILCSRESAASVIGNQLNQRIQENLKKSKEFKLLKENIMKNNQKSLLLILDRFVDFNLILHHSWIYNALVYDTLKVNDNIVNLKIEKEEKDMKDELFNSNSNQAQNSDSKFKTLQYRLHEDDDFWKANNDLPFPEIVNKIEEKTQNYKNKRDKLANLSQVNFFETTKELTNTIQELPNLQKNKKELDKHSNICTSIMSQIQSRKLDEFYELENMIMSSEKQTQTEDEEIMKLLESQEIKRIDKIRLILIHFFAKKQTNLDNLQIFLKKIDNQQDDLSFIKHFTESFKKKKYSILDPNNTFQKIQQRSKNIKKNNLKSYVSKLISSIIESEKAREDIPNCFDVFHFEDFNPKLTEYQEFIVFIVGGGTLIEFDEIKKITQNLIYGTTEILTAESLLNQIQQEKLKEN
ncbi:sec1 family domain-containing protein [Anaeramoeba ignava]|uniref:Sec1 family domain-containing protein n=1 Tax=Anaeramoeba ignava TaxID=1746090 RepID=A0A9Q0LJX5_ANAIG|nr:sec1 family domain-containing protein [Anaeramoeba ignava]